MVYFLITSIMMGVGLALDSATVSMTNGLAEPNMNQRKNFLISLNFGLFQGIMPLIGYFISSAFIDYFGKYIPWIALVLLGFLGTKSIIETIMSQKENRKLTQNLYKNDVNNDDLSQNNAEINEKNTEKIENKSNKSIGFAEVILQGIATSIDALCVGIVIANYARIEAIVCASIIAVITFVLSFMSTIIGKKFGFKFGKKAELASGIILILIGLEICITGLI